ncbi:MAG: hypothetical protein ACI9EW_002768 [Cellvibrionaceae bacterium]|jgi:hypothetical protein
MNRTLLTALLAGGLLILMGSVAWLMIGQQNLQEQLTLKETEVADGEATLVQLFSQKRQENEQNGAVLATAESELAAMRALATSSAPLIGTQLAQADGPTPMPTPTTPIDLDAPPQVRIRLAEKESIKVVGQPIEIIASASHPIGIASLNILVNDETLLTGEPFDPRMDIAVTTWTPLEVGTYQISALATTIRGRASNPVTIEIEVIASAQPEALLQTELRLIERNVRELRDLEQRGEIEVNIIERFDFQENITVDLFDDFTREDADRDVIVLSSFDFMPRDYPLYDSLIQLYGSVVAGYYDEATDALYVISDDNELDKEERLTHAHEYMHALQDQYFTLADIQNGSLDSDATLALRALAEGEASLVEFVYETGGYLTGEQNADSDPVLSIPNAIPAPNFLVSQLAFPYVRGLEFLSAVYEDEGFAGVNRIWERPPVSSEQILHVERYLAEDNPIAVKLPSAKILTALNELGAGWEQLADDVFGEFYLIEYLGLVLDEGEVNPAANGWGGDRYGVYYNPTTTERIMVLKLVWDSPADLPEFTEAFNSWAANFLGQPLAESAAEATCWDNGGNDQCLLMTADGVVITRSDSAELRQLINAIMSE